MKLIFFLFTSLFPLLLLGQNGLLIGAGYDTGYSHFSWYTKHFNAQLGYKTPYFQSGVLYTTNVQMKPTDRLHTLGLQTTVFVQRREWTLRPFLKASYQWQLSTVKADKTCDEENLVTVPSSYYDDPVFHYNYRVYFSHLAYWGYVGTGLQIKRKNTLLQLNIGMNFTKMYYYYTDKYSGNEELGIEHHTAFSVKDHFTPSIGVQLAQVIPLKKRT